jgi:hypothetical protein
MRSTRFAVAGVVTAIALLTGAVPAASSATARSASFSVPGALVGVAASSARSSWAVGFSGPQARSHALAVRWNGTAWRRVPVPRLPGKSELNSVAAISARNVWAVGRYDAHGTGTFAGRPLILHWTGRAWTRVPSPVAHGVLFGVAFVSARRAWAVGARQEGNALIMSWNGHAWKAVRGPAGAWFLRGVTAVSARRAWAVGSSASTVKGLIISWNGHAWRKVTSPHPDELGGVAAVSARRALAVGSASSKVAALGWDGTAWTGVPGPKLPAESSLSGVTFVSARQAWAVGGAPAARGARPLILSWRGGAWRRVASPDLAGFGNLLGVAATSPGSAWAVGFAGGRTLILHWNGNAWN